MGIENSRTNAGGHFSEGARLLWSAKESHGWSQGQLAKAIGAKAGVVPRWLYGDTKPSWNWAVILRDTLEIPLEAWTLEPTTSFVFPAARETGSGPELPSEPNALGADESGEHGLSLPAARPTGSS